MIIMPSNNTGKIVRDLHKKYPDKIGQMLNPRRIQASSLSFIHAVDNDCFNQFDEKRFFKFLEQDNLNPIFVVCPDVVGCHNRTLALWHYYYRKLKKYGFPIAFVAQNGCNPESIPNKADWIFVGGTDPWKMENIHKFVGNGKPVHVGRVNSIGRLKYCESLGVDSIDGTGWLRARDKKFYDFIEYFEGNKQCSLF